MGKIHKKTPHRAAVESWPLGLPNKEEEADFIPCPLVMADFCFPYGCNLFRIAGWGGAGEAGLFANLMEEDFTHLALNFLSRLKGSFFTCQALLESL